MNSLQRSFTFIITMIFITWIEVQAFSSFTISQKTPLTVNMNAPAINRILSYEGDFSIPKLQDFHWYAEGPELKGKMVYNDLAPEYTLMSAGSDWPTMESLSDPTTVHQRVGPLNPIRKAARWLLKLPRSN